MVTQTETRIPNPVLGDMLVETDYSGYKDFGGVKFPATIVQKQGGHPLLDLAVTDVKANVPLDLSIPDAVKQAKLPGFYICSLSAKSLIYKGMFRCGDVDAFYPDLRDPRFEAAVAIFHARYSTNTFPEWRLAQPFL